MGVAVDRARRLPWGVHASAYGSLTMLVTEWDGWKLEKEGTGTPSILP